MRISKRPGRELHPAASLRSSSDVGGRRAANLALSSALLFRVSVYDIAARLNIGHMESGTRVGECHGRNLLSDS